MTLRLKRALIAVGANLPFDGLPPRRTLADAVQALSLSGLKILAQSRLFRTPCFPAGAGPDYVNGALLVDAKECGGPAKVLEVLHTTERRFGRVRESRWGMRTLDLDLVAFDDQVVPDRRIVEHWIGLSDADQRRETPDRLILPHPRMQDRAFVLVPLAEIAPDWRHPILGLTVAEMRDRLDPADRAAVVPLDG